MLKFCAFCDLKTEVRPCECGHDASLSCAAKNACEACTASHRRAIGPFFRDLLASRPASRSNSPRTRFLGILHELVVSHRSAIPRSVRVLDELRELSPFNDNNANFRATILNIADLLPLNAEFAKTLTEKLVASRIVRAAEQLDDAIRAGDQHKKTVGVVSDFISLIVR